MGEAMWSVLGGLLSAAAPSKGGRLETRTARVGATDYSYQVHAPAEPGPEPPVIIFLHGIGQRGAGGYVPQTGAAAALVRRFLARVPALVLLPQCRAGSYWSDPFMDESVMTALSQTEDEFKADSARVYLTGVSMGGYGVWSLASQHAGRFAALVSICGGVHGRDDERFRNVAAKVGRTPAWLFHGADDRVVPVTESRRMSAALDAAGGDFKYSEYPGVGHSVWTQALAERRLMPWLLAQRLTPKP
jgi:predicted peptidase